MAQISVGSGLMFHYSFSSVMGILKLVMDRLVLSKSVHAEIGIMVSSRQGSMVHEVAELMVSLTGKGMVMAWLLMSIFMSGVSLDGDFMMSWLKNWMSVHQIWLVVLLVMRHRLRVVIEVFVPEGGFLIIVVKLSHLAHLILRLGLRLLLVAIFFGATLFVRWVHLNLHCLLTSLRISDEELFKGNWVGRGALRHDRLLLGRSALRGLRWCLLCKFRSLFLLLLFLCFGLFLVARFQHFTHHVNCHVFFEWLAFAGFGSSRFLLFWLLFLGLLLLGLLFFRFLFFGLLFLRLLFLGLFLLGLLLLGFLLLRLRLSEFLALFVNIRLVFIRCALIFLFLTRLWLIELLALLVNIGSAHVRCTFIFLLSRFLVIRFLILRRL